MNINDVAITWLLTQCNKTDSLEASLERCNYLNEKEKSQVKNLLADDLRKLILRSSSRTGTSASSNQLSSEMERQQPNTSISGTDFSTRSDRLVSHFHDSEKKPLKASEQPSSSKMAEEVNDDITRKSPKLAGERKATSEAAQKQAENPLIRIGMEESLSEVTSEKLNEGKSIASEVFCHVSSKTSDHTNSSSIDCSTEPSTESEHESCDDNSVQLDNSKLSSAELSQDYAHTTSSMSNAEKLQTPKNQVKIVPLLLCTEQFQDNSKVYKFEIENDGFQYLTSLLYSNDSTFSSKVNEAYLDLDGLNEKTLKFVGLMGPIKAVIGVFETHFNIEVAESIKTLMKFEQSGLYIINIENEEHLFIVYYSQNDEDFGLVRRVSKIVHFLRYLCELTNNVILCPVENGNDIFPKSSNDAPRIQIFSSRDTRETEASKVTVTELGCFPNQLSEDEFIIASETEIRLISQQLIPPATEIKLKREIKHLNELKNVIDTKQIENLSAISSQFKSRFVETFHNEDWGSIEQSTSKDWKKDKNSSEDHSKKLLSEAIALSLIERVFPLEYQVIASYFSKRDNPHYDIWKIHSDDKNIMNALAEKHLVKLEQIFKTSDDSSKNSIKALLLKDILEATENKYQKSKLRKQNYQKMRAEAENIFKTDLEVSKLIEQEAKNVSQQGNRSWMEDELPKFVKYFSKKVKKVGSSGPSKNKFAAYYKKTHAKRREQFRRNKSEPLATIWFQNYIKKLGKLSNEKIISIMPTENGNDEYEIEFSEKCQVPSHRQLKISLIESGTSRKPELVKGDMCTLQDLRFEHIETIQLESNFSLFDAHPTDKSFLICLLNRSEDQISEVPPTQTTQHLAKIQVMLEGGEFIPIRHKISASSFDSKNRQLAIFCQDNPSSINLISFGPNFRKRTHATQIDLEKLVGDVHTVQMCFQPESSFLWFSCQHNVNTGIYKINHATTKIEPIVEMKKKSVKLLCLPSGQTILNILDSNQMQLIMTATGNVLAKQYSLQITPNNPQIAMFESLLLQIRNNKIYASNIYITNEEETSHNDIAATEAYKKQPFEWHWIRSIYFMFDKFPSKDLLSTNQSMTHIWVVICPNDSSHFSSNVLDELIVIEEKLKATNKSLQFMQIHESKSKSNHLTSFLENKLIESKPLGSFVLKLVTFIPLQIARAESNQLVLMNGFEPLNLNQVKNTFELSNLISFGLYETVFKMWTGDVKVISSMGKQSTGKSYTLNHLTGLSFNISGARCTDGCWMSLKLTYDCMYVILDFEGIGSIERTDQEDMLLSLLNSAISSITLLKCDKRWERDMERLFRNMNMGCNHLKGADDLFRGLFLIIINDVDESGHDETSNEFKEKIESAKKSHETNFLSTLFKRGYSIYPFPEFKTKAYYNYTEKLLSEVQISIPPLFSGGESFMRSIKLLLAKLTIGDFTPLGKQQFDERLWFLQSKFLCAMNFGQLSSKVPKTKDHRLTKIGDYKFEIKDKNNIEFASSGRVTINDLELTFSEDILACIVVQFLDIMPLSNQNVNQWRNCLENFALECIQFRFERVRIWLTENLKPWQNSENSEIVDLIENMFETWREFCYRYQESYRFCDETCAKCFMKCTQKLNHASDIDHECSTDHKCDQICCHCQSQSPQANFLCGLKFGHEGKHNCMQTKHVCNEPCKYSSLSGCKEKCQIDADHSGDHKCSQKSHKCKYSCSLETCFGICVVEAETPHLVHKCNKTSCEENCTVDGCPNKCVAEDHFHGTTMGYRFRTEQNLPDIKQNNYQSHFCGKEHACKQKCQKKGFCHKVVEKTEEESTYQGKKSSFNYNLKFKEVGKKMPCRVKILPFEEHHKGDHACSAISHSCTEQCPTCDNYCNKPVEHQTSGKDVLHDTSHGNMVKRYFLANHDEFDIGAHKYAVGESSVAEMCHIFCNELGRGHTHVVDCQRESNDEASCEIKGEKRHQTAKYFPDITKDKDLMTHHAYWTSIQFKDPCNRSALQDFSRCPVFCSSEEHKNRIGEPDNKSYCELELWHEPVKYLTGHDGISGYVKKGHVFECIHPVIKYHFVFYLSNSESIAGKGGQGMIRDLTSFINRRIEIDCGDQFSILLFSKHATYIIANRINVSDFNLNYVRNINESQMHGFTLHDVMDIMRLNDQDQHQYQGLFVGDGLSDEHFESMKKLVCKKHGIDPSAVGTFNEKNCKVVSAQHPPSVGVSM